MPYLPEENIVFLDIETTGLDPNCHSILEIYAKIIDRDSLKWAWKDYHQVNPYVLGSYPSCDGIDHTVEEMHAKNGLWAECRAHVGLHPKIATIGLWCWLQEAQAAFGGQKFTLAGSSIHFDVEFIEAELGEHAPEFRKYFSHRWLDLTSMRLAINHARRASGETVLEGKRESDHRAKTDVMADIEDYASMIRAGSTPLPSPA